jgi:PAS domain S-box-containing protein
MKSKSVKVLFVVVWLLLGSCAVLLVTERAKSEADSLMTARYLLVNLGGLGAVLGTIYLAFRYLLRKRISAIADRFREAARREGDGAFAPIPLDGDDEFGILAESYNELACRLRVLYESCEDLVRRRTADLESRILEQAEIEEALRVSESRLRVMFDKGPLGIATAAMDRTLLQVNQAYCKMLGYAAEDIQGEKVDVFVYPEDILETRIKTEELAAGLIPSFALEKRYLRKDGLLRWGRTTCTAIRDAAGKPEYLFAIVEDVTASKQAGDALKASERKLRLLAQNVKDVIWTCDMEFRWTYISPSFEFMTGYTADEGLSMSLADILAPGYFRKIMRLFVDKRRDAAGDLGVLTQPSILEAEVVGKGGKRLWAEINASFVVSPAGEPVGIVGITRDISGRKALQLQLMQAKEIAESANRAKSQFIANTCHEIRTPMTAILGYADILRENIKDPEEREAVCTILRNGEHLLEIINGVLDLSKIEAGKQNVDITVCSPHVLTADVVALMRVPAQAKRIQLRIEYENPIPETISTDPVRLRQILINLIGNAIKFTECGEVRISLRLLDAETPEPRLQFRVIDTGVGMAEDDAEGLFQPYSQARSSGGSRIGGTGLGLAISRRLVTMLGGEISVESEPKKGSEFIFAVRTGDLREVNFFRTPAESAAAEAAKPEEKPMPAIALDCRVLLAEDGPDNQKLIAFLLRKAGARVVLAENGERAVELATAAARNGEPFAVILMDMQMPLMDGYQATKKLRSMDYSRPIVALTAHAMADDRQKCLDAGCDDYLTKPINRQRLMTTIARYAELSKVNEVASGKAN